MRTIHFLKTVTISLLLIMALFFACQPVTASQTSEERKHESRNKSGISPGSSESKKGGHSKRPNKKTAKGPGTKGSPSAAPVRKSSPAPYQKAIPSPTGSPCIVSINDSGTTAASPESSDIPDTDAPGAGTLSPTESATDAAPGSTPDISPSATPSDLMNNSASYDETVDLKKALTTVAPVACCLFILLIMAVIMVKNKQKPRCKRCKKTVIPGRIYCEECSRPQLLANHVLTGETSSSGKWEKATTGEKSSSGKWEKAATTEIPKAALGEQVREPTEISNPTRKMKTVSSPPSKELAGSNGAAKEEQVRKKPRPSGRVIAVISVRKGANPGYRFNIYESNNQIFLGKDPTSDIVIDDSDVSNHHAIITFSDHAGFLIRSREKTSGLFINNEKVDKSGLKSGDVIRIGKTELTFARL